MPHSAWGEQISGDSHCLLQTGPWDLSPVWGCGAEGNGWDVGWLLGGADGGNWGLGGAVTPTGWWGWGWGAVSGAALPTDRLHKREQCAGSSHCGQRGRMPSIAGNVGGHPSPPARVPHGLCSAPCSGQRSSSLGSFPNPAGCCSPGGFSAHFCPWGCCRDQAGGGGPKSWGCCSPPADRLLPTAPAALQGSGSVRSTPASWMGTSSTPSTGEITGKGCKRLKGCRGASPLCALWMCQPHSVLCAGGEQPTTASFGA